MKKPFCKILLGSAFLLNGMVSYADDGTAYGVWAPVNGWPGLQYQVKRNSSLPGDQSFTWWVQFDNTYNQKISFSFNLTPPNSSASTLTDGMTLGAGSENADWFIVGSHDRVEVWVGQVTLGDGTTGNAENSQNSPASQQSAAQAALQQQQAQLQQQIQAQQAAAQQRQQQLQQQQAALQQQIADKKAAIQAQQTAIDAKRQQMLNSISAKNDAYLAAGSAVQNAANQIAAMLQQQQAQRDAAQAKQELQEQEDDLANQQRQLQEQLAQLQQQAGAANNYQTAGNYATPNQPQSYNRQAVVPAVSTAPAKPPAPSFDDLLQKATQGDAGAENNLGIMYQDKKHDYTQAVNWYRKAAEQGNAEAQYNLGVMYKGGWGVAKDIAQAEAWYQKAAGQGNQPAKYALSKLNQNKQ